MKDKNDRRSIVSVALLLPLRLEIIFLFSLIYSKIFKNQETFLHNFVRNAQDYFYFTSPHLVKTKHINLRKISNRDYKSKFNGYFGISSNSQIFSSFFFFFYSSKLIH